MIHLRHQPADTACEVAMEHIAWAKWEAGMSPGDVWRSIGLTTTNPGKITWEDAYQAVRGAEVMMRRGRG